MSDDPPHKDVHWWWDISQSFCWKLRARNSAHQQFRQSDSGSLPRISAETTVVTNFISAGSEHLTGTSYTVIYHLGGGGKKHRTIDPAGVFLCRVEVGVLIQYECMNASSVCLFI